jgi:hypothetical protein
MEIAGIKTGSRSLLDFITKLEAKEESDFDGDLECDLT